MEAYFPHQPRYGDGAERIVTLTLNPAIDKSTSVPQVAPEWKLRCTAPRFEPGGGGINVARAIRKLGGCATAFYLAGGPAGEALRYLLSEEGVDQHPIATEGWTRENLVVLNEATGLQYRFGMPGPVIQLAEWARCLERIGALDPPPAYLVASGSLPPGVPEDAYARLAQTAHERGTRLIVDTSGAALRATLQEPVFLLKPNMAEMAALAGREIEGEAHLENETTKLIQTDRCEVVVVSLGAGGALMTTKEGHVRLRAPTVPIQSKVGAGDSMVAGITLALARRLPLQDAVWFGVAAGASAVMTPGTELCRRDDAVELYERMTRRAAAVP